MSVTKKQLTNGIIIAAIAILFFTPLGFSVKVFVNKLFSFSPQELTVNEQTKLTDYNWKLVDIDGRLLDFNDIQGQVILVNFWATWCPPCVAEMPELQKLYDDYNADVTFVFVTNDGVEKVNGFLNKNGYTLPVYFENTRTPDVLASKYLPTTYLIDKNGSIRVSKTGAAAWNSEKTRSLIATMLSD